MENSGEASTSSAEHSNGGSRTKPTSLNIRDMNFVPVTDNLDNIPPTPKTPSSTFTESVIDCCEGCMIQAFVLCHWDNIVGPRISHVWKMSPKFTFSRQLLKTVAVQTLNGEICRDPLDPHIDTKYFMLREHGVIVSSYVFGAADQGELGVHSLSLLIACEKRKVFSNVSDICNHWVKRLVCKLKIFIEKESSDVAWTLFSTQLFYLVQMLLSLKEAGLPSYIPICDSHFHPEHRCDLILLRKAITAHLVTGGRSVVLGPTASQVNLMISSLALFLPEKERTRCRYVSEKSFFPYHPELPVQGLLQTVETQTLTALKDIYLSRYPSAVIDLLSREVRVTSYVHKHYHAHHKAVKLELECLWKEKRNDNYPTMDSFQVVDDPETLVKNFLDDLDLLPPTDGLKEKFIDNFIRLLEKKAFALLKYIEVETESGKKPSALKRKKLRQDMSLTVPGDFKIVLATAERLQSGIYGFMYQDRIKDYVSEQNIYSVPMGVFRVGHDLYI